MKKSDYHYCFSDGTKIFLWLHISCYYHSLSIPPSNIYPINFKTTNSENVKFPKVISIAEINPFKNLINYD